MTPHYLCKSYVDGNNEIQCCTCGKCTSLIVRMFGKRVSRELPRELPSEGIKEGRRQASQDLKKKIEEWISKSEQLHVYKNLQEFLKTL